MKRNVYFCQPDVVRVRSAFTSAYLPYTSGLLWAYAAQNQEIAQAYDLKKIIFIYESAKRCVDEMENPFLCAFSCYVWNTEYNKKIASAVKEKYPGCITVFGGHNIPAGSAFLEENPFVDYIIHGEGEVAFTALLSALRSEAPELSAVPGLHWRLPNGELAETPPQSLHDLSSCPSPYLTGVFDRMMDEYPEIQWACVFETNRGCPYNCAYCNWGEQKSRVRCFSFERVLGEIAWFAAHKIEYIYESDANFGILERDEAIVRELCRCGAETGYPHKIDFTFAKNADDRLLRIIAALSASGLNNNGLTLALQSACPEVLRNVGRENMDLAHYRAIAKTLDAANIDYYCDLILGLPGETFDSFCAGISTVLDACPNLIIIINECALLPNSRMASLDMTQRFQIKTRLQSVLLNVSHQYPKEDEAVLEYQHNVCATSSMNEQAMSDAYLFGAVCFALHCSAAAKFIGLYLHHEKALPYEKIYGVALRYGQKHPETPLGTALAEMKQNRDRRLEGKPYNALRTPYGFSSNYAGSFLFAMIAWDLNGFFADFREIFAPFFSDAALFEDLVRFQAESIRQPGVYTKTVRFGYDFQSYFDSLSSDHPGALMPRDTLLRYIDETPARDWDEYGLRIVFPGMRKNLSLFRIVNAERSKQEIEGDQSHAET